jgi:hypothetical protein
MSRLASLRPNNKKKTDPLPRSAGAARTPPLRRRGRSRDSSACLTVRDGDKQALSSRSLAVRCLVSAGARRVHICARLLGGCIDLGDWNCLSAAAAALRSAVRMVPPFTALRAILSPDPAGPGLGTSHVVRSIKPHTTQTRIAVQPNDNTTPRMTTKIGHACAKRRHREANCDERSCDRCASAVPMTTPRFRRSEGTILHQSRLAECVVQHKL